MNLTSVPLLLDFSVKESATEIKEIFTFDTWGLQFENKGLSTLASLRFITCQSY